MREQSIATKREREREREAKRKRDGERERERAREITSEKHVEKKVYIPCRSSHFGGFYDYRLHKRNPNYPKPGLVDLNALDVRVVAVGIVGLAVYQHRTPQMQLSIQATYLNPALHSCPANLLIKRVLKCCCLQITFSFGKCRIASKTACDPSGAGTPAFTSSKK